MDEKKKRWCLRCGKKFWSLGPGNRICPKCKEREGYQDQHSRTGKIRDNRNWVSKEQ
jgi:hypothetical protein